MKSKGMIHRGYFISSVWVMVLVSFMVTSCATSPKQGDSPSSPPLGPSSKPLNDLPEIFITQTEGEEKASLPIEKAGQLLSFSLKNADIQETLIALSKETSRNIIVDPNVDGKVTVDLKRVTVEEALDHLLIPLGLEYTIRGNAIRVSKPAMETRVFTLDYTITRRKSTGELKVSGGVSQTGNDNGFSNSGSSSSSSGGSENGDEQSKGSIESESETDLWDDIRKGLVTIVFSGSESEDTEGSRVGGAWSRGDEEGRKLIGNPLSGIIMVTAYPVQLARVAEFLEAVSGSVQRQVVIQAKIIEIMLSDEYQLGIDWGYVTNSSGVSGTLTPWDIPEGVDYPSVLQNLSPGLGVFQIGVASKYFNLLIDSLARQGQLNVLSSPQLCTLNNQKAMIKVGREEVYFEINSELQVLDGTERVIENVESKTVTVGIVLDVTPQISSDGTITMCIHPSVSEVAGEATSRLGDTRPIIDVREIDTVISVHEGQMIVIGGLIKDKVEEKITSVPFLGEIPYLGAAFRHTTQNKQKTELVILLTPTLMIGKKIETLTQQQLESLDTAKKGFHLGARPWDYGVQGEYHR